MAYNRNRVILAENRPKNEASGEVENNEDRMKKWYAQYQMFTGEKRNAGFGRNRSPHARTLAAALLFAPAGAALSYPASTGARAEPYHTAQATGPTGPCPEPFLRDAHETPPQMSVYVNSLLTDRNIQPSANAAIQAERQIQNLRNRYSQTRLFSDTVLFAAGPDLLCTGAPLFTDQDVFSRLLRYSNNVEIFSGLSPNFSAPRENEVAAREGMLTAIRNTPGRTTSIFSMHGYTDAMLFSGAPASGEDPNARVLVMTEDIAQAYAARYRNADIRRDAKRTPDVLILESCGSGMVGRDFLRRLRELEAAEPGGNADIVLPIVVTSGTNAEIIYVHQLMDVLLSNGRLQSILQHDGSIGSDRQYSDPQVFVPDPQSGEAVKIA